MTILKHNLYSPEVFISFFVLVWVIFRCRSFMQLLVCWFWLFSQKQCETRSAKSCSDDQHITKILQIENQNFPPEIFWTAIYWLLGEKKNDWVIGAHKNINFEIYVFVWTAKVNLKHMMHYKIEWKFMTREGRGNIKLKPVLENMLAAKKKSEIIFSFLHFFSTILRRNSNDSM